MDLPALPPLLRLPGELRNAIYTFIFQEPNKIISEGGDDTNQLKLVCRQLYHEAAWFELHCNASITFLRENDEQGAPATQFIAFSKNLPARAFKSLNTVILAHAPGASLCNVRMGGNRQIGFDPAAFFEAAKRCGPPENLLKLSEICRAHPNVTFRYILPMFYLPNYRPEAIAAFILLGLAWTYAIRRVKSDDGLIASHARVRKVFIVFLTQALVFLHGQMAASVEKLEPTVAASQSPSSVSDTSSVRLRITAESIRTIAASASLETGAYNLLHVANLKFVATCPSFNEATFRENLLQCKFSSNVIATIVSAGLTSKDALDKWAAKARQWVENGI